MPLRISAATIVRVGTTRRAPAALVALSMLVVACGGGGDTTDSAALTAERTARGDTTVVRITGTPSPSDTLQLEELWRVASGDGTDETAFTALNGVARAPDGTLFVQDGFPTFVWRIAADGTPQGPVGRTGSGPGEYTQVNGAVVLSDGTLVIWDAGGTRLVKFAPDGTALGSVPSPVTGFITTGGLTVDSSDRLWLSASRRVPEVRDSTVPLHVRMRADGTVLDSIERPQLRPAAPVARVEGTSAGGGRTSAAFPIPFVPSAGAEVEHRGTYVRWPGDEYVILADREGGVLRIERDEPVIAVSDAQRDAERNRIERIARRFAPDFDANFDVPATKPPMSAVIPGRDGSLWVAVAAPSRELPPAEDDTTGTPRFETPSTFHVYAHDGTPIGVVTLPARARLLAVTQDTIWGTVRDELDVPTLVAWRVTPAATAARAATTP